MKYSTAILLVALFIPHAFLRAETPTSDGELLGHTVTALSDYVKRISVRFNPQEQRPVSHEELRTSINEGAMWLGNAQERSGHFAYEHLPYEGRYLNDDNSVRQAGALYALGEVARRRTASNTANDVTTERAIAYFERLSTNIKTGSSTMRCIKAGKGSRVCQLGTTALALTGILGYIEAHPEKATTYKKLIDDYGAFIVAAQKPTGGFKSIYRVGTGFDSDAESSFANGEAMLALVRYYTYTPQMHLQEAIDQTFAYIKEKPFDTALYLWSMAALKDMQTLWPSDAYITYGKQYTAWRLHGLRGTRDTLRNYCASTEGLVSAYSLLEKSYTTAERTKLRHEIDFWNTKNLSLQVGPTEFYRMLGKPDALSLGKIQDMEQSRGGFLTEDSEPTQRIDFTQHCMTAYVQTLVDIDKQTI